MLTNEEKDSLANKECPYCHQELVYEEELHGFGCNNCKKLFDYNTFKACQAEMYEASINITQEWNRNRKRKE